VKKLLLEDAAKCKYYQSKITELQSKDKDAAVIEKAGSASASLTTEEPSTKHTQYLKTPHVQVTALHEASLKAAADAATMVAKVKAASSSSNKLMQISLKAAADIATVVTQAEAAATFDKSMQVTSTKASIPTRGAEPQSSKFLQSGAVTADALRTNPMRQVPTAVSGAHRSRVVRVAPRGAVEDSITRGAAPGLGDTLPHAHGAGAGASIISAASKGKMC
jgi:hypothetical protein